ncbi:hypothetical protein KBD45_00845 [Candidatus Dojkabacteria bacterium]|nr:hypothetical protein [Candidatus Dojkabacteria bacterium]
MTIPIGDLLAKPQVEEFLNKSFETKRGCIVAVLPFVSTMVGRFRQSRNMWDTETGYFDDQGNFNSLVDHAYRAYDFTKEQMDSYIEPRKKPIQETMFDLGEKETIVQREARLRHTANSLYISLLTLDQNALPDEQIRSVYYNMTWEQMESILDYFNMNFGEYNPEFTSRNDSFKIGPEELDEILRLALCYDPHISGQPFGNVGINKACFQCQVGLNMRHRQVDSGSPRRPTRCQTARMGLVTKVGKQKL